MIKALASKASLLLTACALALPLALGGCGETVQYEGRIFDMLGANDNSKRQDNNIRERAPLVLPPNARALPAPGAPGAVAAEQNMQWPDDPDERRRAMAAANKDKQKFDAVKAVDSRNEPQPGLLQRMWKGGDDEEAETSGVPEPDGTPPR